MFHKLFERHGKTLLPPVLKWTLSFTYAQLANTTIQLPYIYQASGLVLYFHVMAVRCEVLRLEIEQTPQNYQA